jgi:hypothetical protein
VTPALLPLEFIKMDFIDQLLGDGFSEAIRGEVKLVPDTDLIRQAAEGMDAEDAAFFWEVRKKTRSRIRKEKQDAVVNLILRQFDTTIENAEFV